MKNYIDKLLVSDTGVYYKRFMRLERNQLFKGHSGNMYINEGKLIISNYYFDRSCIQEYDPVSNITKIIFSIHQHTTTIKYKKMMTPLFTTPFFLIKAYNDNYNFSFGLSNCSFTYTYYVQNLKFIDFFDTFNILKVFNETIKKVKENLLNLTPEQFNSLKIDPLDKTDFINLDINYFLQ